MIFFKLMFLIVVLTSIQQLLCVKISVIVPVYNTAPYLERSLNSITNQTLEDIEIICVNDGSSDNSQEILRDFEEKDDRIKVISLETNEGAGYARNIGLELATGEFIGFIDSDDYIDNRYYENLYKYSEGYDIVQGYFVDTLNGVSSYIHHDFHNKTTGYVVDSIFRKSFIDEYELKFPVNLKTAEDVIFREDCYAHNPRIFHTPDEGIYYYYKQREGSTWKKSKQRLKNLYNKIMNKNNNNKKKVKYIKKVIYTKKIKH